MTAPVPPWLLEMLRDQPIVLTPPKPLTGPTDKYAAAAFRSEVDRLARTTEGARNNQLNLAAFALGQLVGAGLLNESEVRTALRFTAIGIGLGAHETDATIASGIGAGIRSPRELRPAPQRAWLEAS